MAQILEEKEALNKEVDQLLNQQAAASNEIFGLGKTIEQLKVVIEEKDRNYIEIRKILENMTDHESLYIPQNVSPYTL